MMSYLPSTLGRWVKVVGAASAGTAELQSSKKQAPPSPQATYLHTALIAAAVPVRRPDVDPNCCSEYPPVA